MSPVGIDAGKARKGSAHVQLPDELQLLHALVQLQAVHVGVGAAQGRGQRRLVPVARAGGGYQVLVAGRALAAPAYNDRDAY